MPEIHEIRSLREEFEHELFQSVLPFWERHSPDWESGGYFNHLDRDGMVYDPTKNVWLQARQVWLFSKLYNDVAQNPRWLELAKLGMEFLRNHAVAPTGHVYFSLTADGKPIYHFMGCSTFAEYAVIAEISAAKVGVLSSFATVQFLRIL